MAVTSNPMSAPESTFGATGCGITCAVTAATATREAIHTATRMTTMRFGLTDLLERRVAPGRGSINGQLTSIDVLARTDERILAEDASRTKSPADLRGEQLGLRRNATSGPVEMLVIDH